MKKMSSEEREEWEKIDLVPLFKNEGIDYARFLDAGQTKKLRKAGLKLANRLTKEGRLSSPILARELVKEFVKAGRDHYKHKKYK